MCVCVCVCVCVSVRTCIYIYYIYIYICMYIHIYIGPGIGLARHKHPAPHPTQHPSRTCSRSPRLPTLASARPRRHGARGSRSRASAVFMSLLLCVTAASVCRAACDCCHAWVDMDMRLLRHMWRAAQVGFCVYMCTYIIYTFIGRVLQEGRGRRLGATGAW